jgi:hypothetical protein
VSNPAAQARAGGRSGRDHMSSEPISRNTVFVAGGQPSVTYVDRAKIGVEAQLKRALAAPNHIVSLSGPTKCGKTVLCRHVLGKKPYIWIDGGQVTTAKDVWDKVCHELNFPIETTRDTKTATTIGGAIKGLIFSANGSQLLALESGRKYRIDSAAEASTHLIKTKTTLVIDDFHYLSDNARREFVRGAKGAVYNGLPLVVLSISHRAFDAIKAEPELTGRFSNVPVPDWSAADLALIPELGFKALNVKCPAAIANTLVSECQSSPFLMQKFCWDICYDLGVDAPTMRAKKVSTDVDLRTIFTRIARDSGLPVYQRLVVGPQMRADRQRRPLKSGGDADVYEATLIAIAETGPPSRVSYNEIRYSHALDSAHARNGRFREYTAPGVPVARAGFRKDARARSY